MNPLTPIVEVIESLSKIEWGRSPGSRDPVRPPFFTWRFVTPNPSLIDRIEAAIRSYSGAVAWSFERGKRNVCITPTAFSEFSGTTRRGDVGDQIAFGELYPEQALAMLDDIGPLAAHLRAALCGPSDRPQLRPTG